MDLALASNTVWFDLPGSGKNRRSRRITLRARRITAAGWVVWAHVLVCVACVPGLFRLETSSDTRVFYGDNVYHRDLKAFEATFQKNNAVLLLMRLGETRIDASPALAAAVRSATERAWRLPFAMWVESLATASETRLTVGLLLDTSESMRAKREDAQSAALTLTDAHRPGDRMLLASFDGRVFVESELTADRGQLQEAISRLNREFSTPTYASQGSPTASRTSDMVCSAITRARLAPLSNTAST